MGGRRGHPRTTQAGLDDRCDRPAYRSGSEDGSGLPNGQRAPGVRARAVEDPFGPFETFVRARLAEDPHLWALSLFDELQPLGFDLSYPTLTRQIRARSLARACLACAGATGRVNAVIEHPPGAETQWDWLDLPDPPQSWGWGKTAHLLVGSLACSGRWRGFLSASMDQPHLVEGLDRISRALGGVTRSWRFDRMATVCHPDSGKITATFAGVATTTACSCAICPPGREPQRGGGKDQPQRRATLVADPGR